MCKICWHILLVKGITLLLDSLIPYILKQIKSNMNQLFNRQFVGMFIILLVSVYVVIYIITIVIQSQFWTNISYLASELRFKIIYLLKRYLLGSFLQTYLMNFRYIFCLHANQRLILILFAILNHWGMLHTLFQ